MLRYRKAFCFLCACIALAATALLITAFVTENWVWSYVYQDKDDIQPDDYGQNKVPDNPNDRGTYLGSIYFGLFNGVVYLNWGAGPRSYEQSSKDYLADTYNEGLWISTIVFCALGIIMGLVTIGFAIYNTIKVPIGMITGIFGLYIWNGLAALFTGICMVLFIIEYYVSLIDGLLNDAHTAESWETQWVHFDYSFWLVVAAFCLLVVNFGVVKLSSKGEDPDMTINMRMTSPQTNKGDMGVVLMY
ncbi:clarin-2-like [Saccoglossus kowalevskii]|uniref:Clarin-2-like n=1 Tax=Saccoglossus kowalevskii TaxID=10224 RepID=A0ABM0GQ96_SACKO|nr:PREDICTED: clarin-2-like [Saccoglossus kowalevskii]